MSNSSLGCIVGYLFSTDKMILAISLLIVSSNGSGWWVSSVLRAFAKAQSRASSFLVSHSL